MVVVAVLALVLSGNELVMRILANIPVIGDTISSGQDARGRIISSQKQLARSGGADMESVRYWEEKYVSARAAAKMTRVVKDSTLDSKQAREMKERFYSKLDGGNGSLSGVAGSRMFFDGVIYVEDDAGIYFREVFLVAIIGEGLEWQKTVGVVNESAIVENPDAEVTIWVAVDADAAREIYTAFEGNASRTDLYEMVVDYAMDGRIQISPFNRFMDFAQEYI